MAENLSADRLHNAARRIREADSVAVKLPLVGEARIPRLRPERVAYYGTLAVLAAAEIIEWPIALVLGVGHVLADNHHSKLAEEIGEALEEA
jgi:hypothetical protein